VPDVRKAAKALREFIGNLETLAPVLDRLASEGRQTSEVEGRLSILKAQEDDLLKVVDNLESSRAAAVDEIAELRRKGNAEIEEITNGANVRAKEIIGQATAEANGVREASEKDRVLAEGAILGLRDEIIRLKKDLAQEQAKLDAAKKEAAALRRKLEAV